MTIETAKYIIALDAAISYMLSIFDSNRENGKYIDEIEQLKKLKLDIYNQQKTNDNAG